MFLSDEPTATHKADGLGMKAYAEVIAGAALGTTGPFTLGVFGKWGEGKTSVLRQAKSLIEEANPDAICVWFNAWQYDHEAFPLVPLALEIAEAVAGRIVTEERDGKLSRWIRWREIGAALRSLASGLTLKTPVIDLDLKETLSEFDRTTDPEAGMPLRPGVYQRAFALLRECADRDAGASSEDRRPPIVVFVDDLDRCLPRHALRLLQSIRLVLSQPGFLFVLAMDADPVVHHLTRQYESLKMVEPRACARCYLDKMVQLPLFVPPHASQFAGFIEKLLGRKELTSHPEVQAAVSELREVLEHGTEANPRAVVRLVNSLIADHRLWKARGLPKEREVDAEWLGFCAISRVLRDKLGDDVYHTLVRADRFCDWLAETESLDDLDERRRTYGAKDESELARVEIEERKVLEPISRLTAVRSLLTTEIGKTWLKSPEVRRTIAGYLAAERRGVAPVETLGIHLIESAIRSELSLSSDVMITDVHWMRVRDLDLSSQRISDDDLMNIVQLANLRSLSLWDTDISDRGMQYVGRLSQLRSLDVGETRVTDAGLEYLRHLDSLEELCLWETSVTNRGLEHLKGLRSLKSLNIGVVQITDSGLEHLEGLTSLEILDLAGAKVTDAGLRHLQGLVELEVLCLAGTKVTDVGLKNLKGLGRLKELSLGSTNVTDDGLEALHGLLQLRLLQVSETLVTRVGAKRLEDAITGLKVVCDE